MVIVSCSGKFHAFNLAEQLHAQGLLEAFYTMYAYQKNRLARRLTTRVDKEHIPPERIRTAVPFAVGVKLYQDFHFWNELFDRWVARSLKQHHGARAFIGWSGMALHSLRRANGHVKILERGSAHIRVQDAILQEEYRRMGREFHIDPRVVKKEMQEYATADFISIPSTFVKNSFIEEGIPEEKLFLNPYGSSALFRKQRREKPRGVFRILYLGSLTVQKGMRYLFDALRMFSAPEEEWEVWFIGKVDDEIRPLVEQYRRPNWKVWGFVNHYELPEFLTQCDVGVMPSLQDGFGMVINQMLACGLPVIATTNCGGPDVIQEGRNGFIVPIRSPEAIAEKLERLFHDSRLLQRMQRAAAAGDGLNPSWEDYGRRYARFLHKILP